MTRDEYFNALNAANNHLEHHGILGQRWGKKNGPPYPLGASDHSTTEKKKGTKGWTKEAQTDASTKHKNTANASNDSNTSNNSKLSAKERARRMTDEELQKANRRQALENQYVKNNPDRDRAWEIAENTRTTANAASDLARKIEKATSKTVSTSDIDISKLSDQELQKIVNRMNLENSYKRLTTETRVNTGAEYVREAIEMIGSMAVLTTAGLTLWSKIKDLKSVV